MTNLAETTHIGIQPVARDIPLREYLKCLRAYLDAPGVTELCINQPKEVWTENQFGWQRHEAPMLDIARLRGLVKLIGTFSGEVCNEKNPILSGVLPDGERVQIVVPPAVEPGTISITIRKPSSTTLTREDYDAAGLTDEVVDAVHGVKPVDERLLQLKQAGLYWEFFELAVREKKNIVISGETGSGKTTFGKTLVNYIPTHERIITIEDTREIFLPNHPNRVHLLYSASGHGTSEIGAKELLQSCLRMNPSRILLAEIRSKVAYDYLVNVSSGHPGSITTTHAGTCMEAFEMLMLRMKESPEGRELAREDIMGLLRAKIEVIIQFVIHTRPDADGRMRKVRRISEVYFEPTASRKSFI